MRRLASAVLLAVSVTACGEDAAPARSTPTAASLTFTNGPDDPGPIVRTAGGDFFLLFNTDRATGLASLIRLPGAQADLIPCGGTQDLEPADLQLVFHESGAINQLLMGRDATAYVYLRGPFNKALLEGGLCFAIETQVSIAQGPVSFVAHDNDTFFSGTHANAFGWSATGTVVSAADGATLRFHSESHGVVASDGSLLNIVNRITLTP